MGHMQLSAQEVVDYTALGEPSFAQRLSLSDEQIAQVARILDERRNAIVTAQAEERQQVFQAANDQLAALLTDNQKQAFALLVAGGKLRFSFQDEPWPQVLEWVAGQANLALVMNDGPPGSFTYSDTKNHSPIEAIRPSQQCLAEQRVYPDPTRENANRGQYSGRHSV